MIKIFGLILIMLSFSIQADIEIRVSDMDYRWGDAADYPVTALHIGYTHWIYNTGFKIEYGESDKAKNIKNGTYENLSVTLKDFWVFSLFHRLPISETITLVYGIHYTEYREHVSRICYQYTNLDTDFGHGIGVEYKLNEQFSVKWSIDDYYRKHHDSLGFESTKGESLSLIYKN